MKKAPLPAARGFAPGSSAALVLEVCAELAAAAPEDRRREVEAAEAWVRRAEAEVKRLRAGAPAAGAAVRGPLPPDLAALVARFR